MGKKPEAITSCLGQAIRERRYLLELSQEQLASRCNLHRTYVADVERGNRNPSVESLEKIAKGLACKLSHLFRQVERITDNQGGRDAGQPN